LNTASLNLLTDFCDIMGQDGSYGQVQGDHLPGGFELGMREGYLPVQMNDGKNMTRCKVCQERETVPVEMA